MARICHWLAALAEWLAVPRRAADEMPGLTLRDWADLPPYHPCSGCE